jgi:Asp-tRNA(Asn)/Glu-tRNA(Gln) amidotransferase C subunit
MGERKPVTAGTVAAMAAENAGHPLEPERAAAYAEALEPILQAMEALRALPIKDVEPAVVFQPVEVSRDD